MYAAASKHLICAGIVRGDSMAPTLLPGMRYFINRYIYHLRDPQRGDIVVFSHPLFRDLTVKRVIGLPGELVEERDGKIYVNHRALDEPYLAQSASTAAYSLSNTQWRVPPRCYFVMGDNRAVSTDSRSFGPVPREDIIGEVICP